MVNQYSKMQGYLKVFTSDILSNKIKFVGAVFYSLILGISKTIWKVNRSAVLFVLYYHKMHRV